MAIKELSVSGIWMRYEDSVEVYLWIVAFKLNVSRKVIQLGVAR
jgi:hypothetical protein